MLDVNINSLENLKTWLAGRKAPEVEDKAIISAPEGLRSVGFLDLILEKAGPQHQETVTSGHDFALQKPKFWTELAHLTSWSKEFISALRNNLDSLATLELVRAVDECPISLARYRVEESINVVQSAITFDLGWDVQHPDTRGQNYAAINVLIDDSICLQDIVRQIFTSLFSKCVVRVIVKTNNFYSAALATYLVDLMHVSGASPSEINCIALDRRESIGNEHFTKPFTPNKSSKLSTIATVFKQTDTFAAAQCIIDAYFRDQYPNLIILVEEAAYERFVQDWQRYYSNVIHIGSRLDERTVVVDSFNSKVQIDLAAIDIKASHKMSGHVINVLKFRTLSELISLLGNLRKVPYMSVWNDDILLSREFCLRLNQCNDFWLNHLPRDIAGYKLPEDMLNFYYEAVLEDMTYIYNSVYSQYGDEADQLRKTQAAFQKKESSLKTSLIFQAYISIITKCKSLRNGSTIGESVARLKRFQYGCSQRAISSDNAGSRIEITYKPVGLAILMVREEGSLKNKAILLEFIFKNLLLGNAVLLSCPPNTLGAKFAIENDHVVPFKMVHDSLPDISRLSLDASIEASETSVTKKQCPKNTFAFEVLPEMSSEACETITIALGSRRKSIWLSNTEQSNYWNK